MTTVPSLTFAPSFVQRQAEAPVQAAASQTLRVAREGVVPAKDCYIGTYAVGTDEGYVAYAKLFLTRPDSAWSSRDVVFKVSAGPVDSPEEATRRAMFRCQARWIAAQQQPDARMNALKNYLVVGQGPASSSASAA